MDTQTRKKKEQALVLTLWGALFIKCFTLEYLVQHYAVAINSTFYVWALSIFMATVATFIYLAPRLNSKESIIHIPIHVLLWLASGISMVALITLSKRTDAINPVAALATVLGLTYCLQGFIIKQIKSIAIGLCWWLSAAVLFRTAAPLTLLFFAISILTLHLLPNLLTYFSYRKAQKN